MLYRVSYSPNNDSEVFTVNPDTGEILVNEILLSPGKHTIIVNASDQPVDPKEMKYSLAVVTITIFTEGILTSRQNVTQRLKPYVY